MAPWSVTPAGMRTACHRDAPLGMGSVGQTCLEPVTAAGVHGCGDDLGRQAIHRGPGGPAVGGIGRETRRFYRPVILAFQGPDDGGKRNPSAKRLGAGLVRIGQQDRKHGPTRCTRAREYGRLGRHADILSSLIGDRRIFAMAVGPGGQDFESAFGDCHHVLPLRGQRMVLRDDGPAVGELPGSRLAGPTSSPR